MSIHCLFKNIYNPNFIYFYHYAYNSVINIKNLKKIHIKNPNKGRFTADAACFRSPCFFLAVHAAYTTNSRVRASTNAYISVRCAKSLSQPSIKSS